MSFELKEGEIPLYSDLAHGVEQALGLIQPLEAAVQLLSTEDLGLQADGQTCGWLGIAEQQIYIGALQYGDFEWSDCAR